MSSFAQAIDYYNLLGYRNKQKASPMTKKLSNAEHWYRMIGKQVSLQLPFFFSRTNKVFKDSLNPL